MLLIFDWDGTLIDSTVKITRCMQAAISENCLPQRSDEQVRNIIGLALSEAINHLFDGVDDTITQRVKEAYSNHFIKADEVPCSLYPGVMVSLQSLKADGHTLAVATGKSRRGLDRVLGNLGLSDFFDTTRCADESRSKPDPLMLRQILQELDVGSASAVMVGDTEYDLNMARNAGMASVAVSYGAHDVDRLQLCSPIHIIDHFPQLLEWVSARYHGTE
jgi:phosphoglycolate phosphatase